MTTVKDYPGLADLLDDPTVDDWKVFEFPPSGLASNDAQFTAFCTRIERQTSIDHYRVVDHDVEWSPVILILDNTQSSAIKMAEFMHNEIQLGVILDPKLHTDLQQQQAVCVWDEWSLFDRIRELQLAHEDLALACQNTVCGEPVLSLVENHIIRNS